MHFVPRDTQVRAARATDMDTTTDVKQRPGRDTLHNTTCAFRTKRRLVSRELIRERSSYCTVTRVVERPATLVASQY